MIEHHLMNFKYSKIHIFHFNHGYFHSILVKCIFAYKTQRHINVYKIPISTKSLILNKATIICKLLDCFSYQQYMCSAVTLYLSMIACPSQNCFHVIN